MFHVTNNQFVDAINQVNEAFDQLIARVDKLEKELEDQKKKEKPSASKKTRPKTS